MAEISQSRIQQQGQISTLLQTQSIIMMPIHELEERIDMELMQNPALELEDPLADEEDDADLLEDSDDDQWNEDFDKPIDEMETGGHDTEGIFDVDDICASLERVAVDRWGDNAKRLEEAIQSIDDYRQSGIISDDILIADLTELEAIPKKQPSFPICPDIEVVTDNGEVEVRLVNNKGDYLKSTTGMGKDTIKAQKFIADIQHRKRVLQKLCDLVLAELQKDFFLTKDFPAALLDLLPIQIPVLCGLITDELFKTKSSMGKFIYRTENLMVSCHHGCFPFNFFLPSDPAILLLLITEAKRNGQMKQEDQRQWILEQSKNRVSMWPPDDSRHEFIKSLINVSIDDIKYANKKAKRDIV